MSKQKLTKSEICNKISKLHGDLVIIDYDTYISTKKVARFIDKTYGEWWTKPKNVLGGSRHPSIRTKSKRGLRRKYSLNEDFFKVPTVENCYFAGFIAADGCILDKNHTKTCSRVLNIRLNEKDVIILENFKRAIEYTGPIRKYGNIVDIRITSDRVSTDLLTNFNITPRKSLTLKPPNIKDPGLIKSFIIGYIDGDGYISAVKYKNNTYYLRLGIIGTVELTTWVNNFLDKEYGIGLKNIRKNDNIYVYTISSKQAEKVMRDLTAIKVPKLTRKWDKLLLLNPITEVEL